MEKMLALNNIKMIVTDLDGTFLDNQHDFNRKRFQRQLFELMQNNIHFVVATGRQFQGGAALFSNIEGDITYIADNGSNIRDNVQCQYIKLMEAQLVEDVITKLDRYGICEYVISAASHAYVNKAFVGQEFLDGIGQYYLDLIDIEEGYKSSDVLKFTVRINNEELKEILKVIGESAPFPIVPISSGYNFVDLIDPTMNKANGVRKLQDLWNIQNHQVMVFGDSDNDKEMLASYRNSFAMKNAPDHIKKSAQFVAGSNNNEGVLEEIDLLLKIMSKNTSY